MKFKNFIKKLNATKKPLLAVLIDPDKFNPELIGLANVSKVSCFLVGGSVIHSGNIRNTVKAIKKISSLPVILFPGDETQLTKEADGLFLPSLLSGNNSEYLIGKQIVMAPIIKRLKLQHIPMAYLLLEGNVVSSTQQVTKTKPMLLTNKKYIIYTALAAQQLGFKAVYLEAGSGAKNAISSQIIKHVKSQISIPVIVGGGIDSKQKAEKAIHSGANLIVVGNALEKNVYLLTAISSCF